MNVVLPLCYFQECYITFAIICCPERMLHNIPMLNVVQKLCYITFAIRCCLEITLVIKFANVCGITQLTDSLHSGMLNSIVSLEKQGAITILISDRELYTTHWFGGIVFGQDGSGRMII